MKQFTNSNEPNGDVLDGVELMDWFVGQRKINYPATLYVTVKGTHVSAANLPRKTFGRMSEVSVNAASISLLSFLVGAFLKKRARLLQSLVF